VEPVAAGELLTGTPGPERIREVGPAGEASIAWHTGEGTNSAVIRYRLEGASGLRLHFEGFALRPGEAVYVTAGGKSDGPYTGTGPLRTGEFWTRALAGEEVVVEWQTPFEDPGGLPFVIRELAEAHPEPVEVTAPVPVPETVVSVYRGVPVTHEVIDGLAIVEGDIILGPAELLERAAPGVRGEMFTRGTGVSSESRLWPGGVVPYTVAADAPNPSRIEAAVAHWNEKLGGSIKLQPRTNESVYLSFVKASSASTCASYIGRLGMAGQPIFVGSYCSTGNLIHEVGHALGLYHEHVRLDRDSHVEIKWENIKSGTEGNFTQDTRNSMDLGLYDYGSIMHYGAYAFSSNGQPTIVTIPSGIAIGQRTALSSGDVGAAQTLYPAATTGPAPAPEPAPAPAPAPEPTPVPVTVASNPSGRQVNVDGTLYTTPRSFSWLPGSSHTISALDGEANGTRYRWMTWSDSGAQTHTYVTPSSTATVSATYMIEHTVSSKAASASGTVAQSPVASGNYLQDGQSASFTAQPGDGLCFTGWSGSASGAANPLALTVRQPVSVTANFGSGAVAVSPSTVSVSSAKQTFNLQLSVTTGCPWRATSSASWIKLSKTSGQGSAALTVTVTRNTAKSQRVGTVTISGVAVKVTQAGR
jgi:astacin